MTIFTPVSEALDSAMSTGMIKCFFMKASILKSAVATRWRLSENP
jgi:hypothetical protein